jgi:hypothetical protein
MSIVVEITMPRDIRTVQSPSHTIAMHLGGHVQDVEVSSFNPKCALATLSQTTAELGADFILLIKCALSRHSTGAPRDSSHNPLLKSAHGHAGTQVQASAWS